MSFSGFLYSILAIDAVKNIFGKKNPPQSEYTALPWLGGKKIEPDELERYDFDVDDSLDADTDVLDEDCDDHDDLDLFDNNEDDLFSDDYDDMLDEDYDDFLDDEDDDDDFF